MTLKKCYTLVALMLLILLYLMIFFLSSEDAESSSDISTRVTKALLQFYYSIKGSGGNQQNIGYVVSATEGFIRKLAHFAEYAGVGFLSYSIVAAWYGTIWKGRLVVLIQLLLSAGADEVHQYFVPGRNASVKDVMIDLAGGIAGMIVMLLWIFLWKRVERYHNCSKSAGC